MESQANVGFTRLMLGLVVFFEMIYCIVFAPLQEFKDVIVSEQQSVAAIFGEEDTRTVYARADGIYSTLLLDTGLAATIVGRPVKDSDSFANLRRFARERAQVMLNYAYLIISRLAVIVTWIPLFFILFAAGIHDGLCMREIKKTNFDWVSPVMSRYASRAASLSMLVLFMALMAPLGFTPLIIPACVFVSVAAMTFTVRNIQKRI